MAEEILNNKDKIILELVLFFLCETCKIQAICLILLVISSYRPYFWNSHSWLHSGQSLRNFIGYSKSVGNQRLTWRVFSQRDMQWK